MPYVTKADALNAQQRDERLEQLTDELIASYDAVVAEKDAEIARLRALLANIAREASEA